MPMLKLLSEQESPPVWMQEAYHPLHSHSKLLLFWGCPSTKKFFPSLNMYEAKSGVKNFSLYWEGVPRQKIFFPVWTCIKPNLVSKIFPFPETGYPPKPETRYPPRSEIGYPPTWTRTWDPPNLRPGTPPDLRLGTPPPGPGTPPTWTWDSPQSVDRLKI